MHPELRITPALNPDTKCSWIRLRHWIESNEVSFTRGDVDSETALLH